jgi:hypothetical protein
MDSEILFEEVQTFNKKPVQLFCKISIGILIAAIAIILFKTNGEINSLIQLLFVALIICVAVALLSNIKMVTQIRTDGIYVSFSPFHPRFEKYLWSNIEEVYLREYNAMREYFGWGIKTGPSGMSYTHSGNMGIQISLLNKSKILIGTQQPEKIQEVLESLKVT